MNRMPRTTLLPLACALAALLGSPAAHAQAETPAAPANTPPGAPLPNEPTTEPQGATIPNVLAGQNAPGLRPYYFSASETVTYDSNLFRVSSNSGFKKQSDVISTTSVGAGISQPFGRQRFYGNAAVSATRYRDNDQLNGTGYNLLAGLDWEAGSKFSGNASALSSRSQANFANYGSLTGQQQKNQEKANIFDLRGQYGGRSLLTLEAQYNHTSLNYTANTFGARDRRSDTFGGGLRVRPGGPWSYGVTLRETKGRYDGVNDGVIVTPQDDYRRHDIDFSAAYQASGRSTFLGRVSYTREQHDFDFRDFSGVTGALNYTYIYSGKLTLGADLSRDTNSGSRTGTLLSQPGGGGVTQRPVETASFLNDSRTSDTLALTAIWQARAKVLINALASYSHERFDDSFVSETGNNNNGRTGNQQLYSVSATYAGGRVWSVGCGYSYESRHTNLTLASGGSYGYSANLAYCNGALRFQ